MAKRKSVPNKVEQVPEEEEEEEEESDPEEEEEEEEESEEQEEEEESESESESEEESESDAVRKLLEPFGKYQLLEILKEAALKNDSILNQIVQVAETDTIHRKIFVHGLGWDASNDTLLATFKQYGEIEDGNVVTDKLTGKSKGYGFVLFKTRDGATRALKEPQKKIGNRMTSCQLASFGPVPNHPVPDSTGRKIYVSNVGPHIDPEKLRAFFAKFGDIEEGPLGYDRLTGKLKGFALFVYKTVQGCKKALEEPTKMFEGCQLQCKRALDGLSKQKNDTLMGPSPNLPLNYSMGLNPNPPLLANPAPSIYQNSGFGLLNPAAALGAPLNHTGYSPSAVTGLSPSTTNRNEGAAASPLGLRSAYGLQSSINNFSPSVIGNYGSQAALHGLGAYQNTHQLGQSSAMTTAISQSGIGSLGTLPSYLGR